MLWYLYRYIDFGGTEQAVYKIPIIWPVHVEYNLIHMEHSYTPTPTSLPTSSFQIGDSNWELVAENFVVL